MKFILMKYDYDNGTYSEETKPFENAYQDSEWDKQTFKSRGESWHNEAYIADDGTARLRVVKTPLTPINSDVYYGGDKNWFTEGRNHQQISETEWYREVEYKYWCIDFDTLETLAEFCKQQRIIGIAFDEGQAQPKYFWVYDHLTDKIFDEIYTQEFHSMTVSHHNGNAWIMSLS